MNKKLLSLTTILLSLVFLLTGCWDSLQINKRHIVNTVLLDKQEDTYIFYLEIANTDNSGDAGSGDSGGAPKYLIIKGEGSTIPKARESLERQLDKPIYLSAVRALILTTNITGDDLVAYFNRLREEVEYRKKVMTVTTDENPAELFKTINEAGKSVGFYSEDLLLDIEKAGQTFLRPTIRLIENISGNYSCFIIPSIGLNENSLELKGYSIVGGKDFVGFIPKEECRGLIYLKNSKTEWIYVLDYKDTEFTVSAKLKKKKITPHYDAGKISFDLEFTIDGELRYLNKTNTELASPQTIDALEKILEEKITKDIEEAIEIAKSKYGWDYLSLDDEFYMAYPAIYRKLDWHDEFSKIKTNIKVEAKIAAKTLMDYYHKAVE